MVRWIGISFAVVLALLLALTGAAWIVLQTPYGATTVDKISRPIIENQVRDQLGAEISYAPLIGPLPRQLVIEDLTLSTDDEVWFESESIVLSWNPWALLRRNLSIENIIIDNSKLHQLPDRPVQAETPSQGERQHSGKRSTLPIDINVATLIIDDFTLGSEILGDEHTLSLQANIRYWDPRLTLTLHAQTSDGLDELYVLGDISPGGGDMDVVLVSQADGALALASQAEDRIELRLRTTGELGSGVAEIGAALGRYGNIMGTAAQNAESNYLIHTDLTYEPGTALPSDVQALFGQRLQIAADISERRDAVDVELQTFSGAFGAIAGDVQATWGRNRTLQVDLEGALSEDVLASFGVGDLGGGFGLQATADQQSDGYGFDLELQAGALELEVTDGQTSEEVLFEGNVSLELATWSMAPDPLAALLVQGSQLDASARLTAGRILSLSKVRASFGGGEGEQLRLRGDIDYDISTPTVVADVSAVVQPGALALFVDETEAADDLSLAIKASGALDNLVLSVDGTIPSGTFRGQDLPSGTLRTQFSGLPFRPTGELSLDGGESYDLSAAIRTDGRVSALEALDAHFGALTLAGKGVFDRESKEGRGTFDFDAGDRTRLITGQVVSGRLTADVSNIEIVSGVNVDILADELRFNDQEIGSLSINASGPSDAIVYDVAASDIVLEDLFVHAFNSNGRVSIDEAREIAIETLTVRLSDDERDPQEVRLVRPTTARWGDGIQLGSTRLAWFDDGIVTANAAISKDSWVAQVAAQRIAVPDTDTFVSLQLNLDTNDTDPASFQIVAATEGRDDRYAVRADGRWTGQEVLTEGVIIRSGRERLGSFDAATPLTLTRTSGLAVEIPEASVTAALTYNDTFAPILAFLPVNGEPISGQLDAMLNVSGPLLAPEIEGLLTISETRIEDPTVGISLLNLGGDIAIEGRGADFTASVDLVGSGRERRAGSVKLSGDIRKTSESGTIDLLFVSDRAQLARNAELELRLTTDLALIGSFEEATLSGPITINELDFAIPDTQAGDEPQTFVPVNIVRTDVPEAEQEVSMSQTQDVSDYILNLDMTVDARNSVFVRGRGVESEWAIDLDINGTADDPQLRGTVNSIDGTLDLAGRSFSLTEGLVSFTPETGLDPTLDVQAETVTGTAPDQITAIAEMTGPASQPIISFSSDPTLPEEDVLALILFGRPATELGAAEALQLAQAAATLTGTGPFGGAGLGNGLRSGLGLDRLSYDPEGNSLTVGKYIADDVYVSAVQGIGELGTAFSVVYEVSRFFSLETTLKSNGAQSLSGNYKRDY